MSQSRVRVDIPKNRRNRGEVRPYDELPSSRNSKSDAVLLWGTTVVLTAGLLIFGAVLFYKNSAAAVPQPEVIDIGSTHPKDLLAQSRQNFIRGDFRQALSQARVGLALEQQTPSDPPLEKDLRRAIGLADLELKDFGEAVEQFGWLDTHFPSPDDRKNLEIARANNKNVTAEALHELVGAQQLSVKGVQDKAYAQASRAVSSLQRSRGQAAQVQAGHLVMANIALRRGDTREALLRLREARKLGPLTAAQLEVLQALEKADPAQKAGLASAQMPVVVPRLESRTAYPQARPGSRPIDVASRPVPAPPEQPQAEDPGDVPAAPPPRKAPRLELPKLQFPNGATSSASGGLPGYQNNNSSSSLPGYNTQTRSRDTLPGY
ncbi:MAG: hypothetical protein U0931_09535 [Vulcanimicrobiota bacterium]